MKKSLQKWWHVAKSALNGWIDDNAPSMGAAIAYYTALSLAPLLLIVVSVAGFVYGQTAAADAITSQFRELMGNEGARVVRTVLQATADADASLFSIVVGAVVLLLGATTVFAELQGDLDRIWKVEKPNVSSLWMWVRTRLLSFGLVLAVGFLLLASLVVTAVIAALNEVLGPGVSEVQSIASVLNFVASLAIISVLFALIYKLLPSTQIAWSDVWVGAIVTAALFSLGKYAIGLYLGTVAFSSTFGAAGAFVVLMVWIYYASQIFLLGAEFTYHHARLYGSLSRLPASAVPTPSPAGS